MLIVIFNKRLKELTDNQKPNEEIMQIVKMLQESGTQDRQTMMDTLQKNTASMNERLDKAARVIGDVQKNLGEMSEIGRGMKELQDFLKSPKLRGNVGEQVLKELLGQMLPKKSFHLQYSFKSGAKVDAAIQTSAGMVPIDSKFPMEEFTRMMGAETEAETKRHRKEFERSVRKHINDISKKYILTDEGTIDYALMYVPSEAVYYEIVNSPDLFDYSSKMRVLPVSPTTFYAYLRAILMSFEGQKIEQRAKEILATIRAIQKDYSKMDENLGVLQSHMNNATNKLNDVYAVFTKLGQKITSTKSLGEGMEEQDDKLIEG